MYKQRITILIGWFTDVIEKTLSCVVSMKNNSNLKKIINSFVNETLNITESFMKDIDILKKKVDEGIVEAKEIKQDIEKCENEYGTIIDRKIYLFNKKLKYYIAIYINNICNGDVDVCLRLKVCNTIRKLIDINKNILDENI